MTCAAAIKRNKTKAVGALPLLQLAALNKTLLMESERCKLNKASEDKLAQPCKAPQTQINTGN